MPNPNDILQKTELGIREIKEQNDPILPREARNILILINGKSSLADYRASLNKSKVFADAGGIDQYVDLLLSMDYLEVKPVKPTQSQQPVEEIVLGSDAPTIEARVVNLEQHREDKLLDSIASMSNAPPTISQPISVDEVRTALAEIIEASSGLTDTWNWLFRLEECTSAVEFVALIRGLRDAGIKAPRDLSKLEKRLRAK
ncbi:MAG: hypothetical protein AAF270_14835 [Pseudomonadota bacterium]